MVGMRHLYLAKSEDSRESDQPRGPLTRGCRTTSTCTLELITCMSTSSSSNLPDLLQLRHARHHGRRGLGVDLARVSVVRAVPPAAAAPAGDGVAAAEAAAGKARVVPPAAVSRCWAPLARVRRRHAARAVMHARGRAGIGVVCMGQRPAAKPAQQPGSPVSDYASDQTCCTPPTGRI